MRVGFVADVHIANHRRHGGAFQAGLNERCRLVLTTLQRAVMRAEELGCQDLVILGDLFDTTRPEPQVITGTQRALDARHRRMKVHVLKGNHDMDSETPGDHALGPLAPVCHLVTEPQRMGDVLLVPFQAGPAVTWLPAAIAKVQGEEKSGSRPADAGLVLALHLGISAPDSPEYLRICPDQVPVTLLQELAERYGIGAVVAGNWHSRRLWMHGAREFMQVGTLCPTGYDNPGLEGYGTLAIWERGKPLQWEEIPGPRFVKYGQWEGSMQAMRRGCALFVSASAVQVEDFARVQEELTRMREQKLVVAFEVLPDEAEAVAAARTAASMARGSDTVEGALVRFVDAMPLPEGVDRGRVLERVRGYLR